MDKSLFLVGGKPGKLFPDAFIKLLQETIRIGERAIQGEPDLKKLARELDTEIEVFKKVIGRKKDIPKDDVPF